MKGVLLMAYGGPTSLDQVEAYYTHIRGGRKPSSQALEDLVRRYEAIGGSSPLLEITQRQAAGLERSFKEARLDVRVYAGMKHSHPFIGEVMTDASSEGVDEMLCVALAPHYSSISIGGYQRAVDEANSALGGKLKVKFVKCWHTNPKLISMWSNRVKAAAATAGSGAELVFSAHSLPERIIREGDPYKDQLLETSRLVAENSRWAEWSFTFQSQSRTEEPWLGPDILDHLQILYDKGRRTFISAPIGFVSDHLEILYDIDIECREWAKKRGANLVRCESPNDSREMTDVLFAVAEENGFA